MITPLVWIKKVVVATCLSSAMASAALAHEVMPAVADFTVGQDQAVFDVELNLEGLLAGVDLTAYSDTNDAPEAATYDRLHEMSPVGLQVELDVAWPKLAQGITVLADGAAVPVRLGTVSIPQTTEDGTARVSKLSFIADMPADAQTLEFGWAKSYGAIVIRQQGVDAPYTGYLEAGAMSEPIAIEGGDEMGQLETFTFYIPVGFEHIVPLGLDHILFVLGLFFLSTRMKPLLWQVSAFTVAHTITLALAALGYVRAPGAIVEPLIAASIVFVAVENILAKGLTPWRPVVVFGFGLLHGLGFASVLGDYGLPDNAFIPALIGFNIGVELGQLSVIAVAFIVVGFWFGNKPWYRRVIAIPASIGIALVGAYWCIERVFF